MEKIQSLGMNGNGMQIIYVDGETEKFQKCPFFTCFLYHAADLDVCPTTGLSIVEKRRCLAEEEKSRKELAEKQRLAEETRTKYQLQHLPGWLQTVSLCTFLALIIVLLLATLLPRSPWPVMMAAIISLLLVFFF
ncbi:MAG: hypothetical protein AAB724_02620, partial [Patescibacteria group bacterium]